MPVVRSEGFSPFTRESTHYESAVRERSMKRASIALVLSLAVLSVGSPEAPAVESHQEAVLEDGRTRLLLQERVLYVYRDGHIAWTSDPTWDVRQFVVADVDNDGEQEAAVVLWKPFHREPHIVYDTYGFPSPCEEGSLRNHLFVYGWRDHEWKPLWCSSPIADPILELAVEDVDGDGANELVVLEGSYGDALDAPARHVAVWQWNGWGFVLQRRSPAAQYENLSLSHTDSDHILDVVTDQP
jgi:hypothetical protein